MKKGIILLLSIPLFLNLGEVLNPKLDNNILNLKFIVAYIIPLILSILMVKSVKLSRIKASNHIINRLSILASVSSILFLWFLATNVKAFNLLQYAHFMESYRNSAFKGSGIFTFMATNIFPLTYCYCLLQYKIPRKPNIIFAIVASLPPLMLGLRVWLIPLFIVGTILFFNNKKNLIQLLTFGLLISLIILSTKLILAPELYSSGFQEVVLKILSRTNYQSISTPININLLNELLESLNFYDMKEYFYYKNQNHIESLYFNRIGNTGGIAMPITIFIINTLGYFVNSIMLFLNFQIIFYLLKITTKGNIHLMMKNMSLNLSILLIAMIIEDIYFATKIFILPLLMILAQLIFVKKPFKL